MKNAFVVVGAESSGNRLMTRLLINAGCHGNGTTDQPTLQEILDSGKENIVIHRSFPFGAKGSGRDWPDLMEIHFALVAKEYLPVYIVMVRDPFCAARSAMKAHHIENIHVASYEHDEAYRKIFATIIKLDLPYIMVTYEGLVSHPAGTIGWLFPELGLPARFSTETIEDANVKHFVEHGLI